MICQKDINWRKIAARRIHVTVARYPTRAMKKLNNIFMRILVASMVMLLADVFIELLFEGNLVSIYANPLRTIVESVMTGIFIVIVQELIKETIENQKKK